MIKGQMEADLSDHEALIARLENLTGPDRDVDRTLMELSYKWEQRHIGTTCWDDGHDTCCVGARHMTNVWADPATDKWCTTAIDGYEFTDSLDRTVALTKRLLPGAEFSLTNIYGLAMAEVPLNGPTTETGHHKGGSLPIALLIATLRALPSSTPLHGEQP